MNAYSIAHQTLVDRLKAQGNYRNTLRLLSPLWIASLVRDALEARNGRVFQEMHDSSRKKGETVAQVAVWVQRKPKNLLWVSGRTAHAPNQSRLVDFLEYVPFNQGLKARDVDWRLRYKNWWTGDIAVWFKGRLDTLAVARRKGLSFGAQCTTAAEAARCLRKLGYDSVVDERTGSTIVRHLGDTFHLPHHMMWSELSAAGAAAVAKIEYRLAQDKKYARLVKLDQCLAKEGDKIQVAIADSLTAGNCRLGTQEFVQSFRRHLRRRGVRGLLKQASAADILKYRDDCYTRRACRVAALRFLGDKDEVSLQAATLY